MSSSNRPFAVRPGQTSTRPPPLPQQSQLNAALNRELSQSSNSSTSSRVTALSSSRPSPSPYSQANVHATNSTASLSIQPNLPRKVTYDLPIRADSPSGATTDTHRHRARKHSQGFFEPTLPTTTTTYSSSPSMAGFTASQIAAQAAMQVQSNNHARRRSQTVPDPMVINYSHMGKRKPSYPMIAQNSQSSNDGSRASSQTRASGTVSAATAASAAYPRSPMASPILQQTEYIATQTNLEKEPKPNREKSRIKIFSKPKNISVPGNKDQDKKGAPSPKKIGTFHANTPPRSFNQSTTSLVDPSMSSASSIYSTANTSTSTLVPADKEKRHNFLSRQKLKIKDANEHHNLTLSSAASNSRPTDPNAQQLYSFVPSSPAPGSSFNRSKTGLDLRHGGRALREKKREEKAAAGTFIPPVPSTVPASNDALVRDGTHSNSGTPDWLGPTPPIFGPPVTGGQAPDNTATQQNIGAFGFPGINLDDAWPPLRARLLIIFEGEDIRTPIEDFNRLLTAHLQRSIPLRTPDSIIDELRDLVNTGFNSLDQTIRRVPDHRLVPHLVDMWSFVFGTILPFLQAVFHPLDLELKGHGTVLSPKDAADYWGTMPAYGSSNGFSSLANIPLSKLISHHTAASDVIDVRSTVLKAFRDVVMLPRHDVLLSIFSRLSLDNIHAVPLDRLDSPPLPRPGTAASSGSAGHADIPTASFNSQGSTLLDSSTAGSLGARSRATSNTSARSAGSFQSMVSSRPHANSHGSSTTHARSQAQQQVQQPVPVPPVPVIDSAQVTQTAARMLQCVSVLAGLQGPALGAPGDSGAEEMDGEPLARKKMERLGKELKLNWLGRGRTGRNRRGFVGSKVRNPTVGVAA